MPNVVSGMVVIMEYDTADNRQEQEQSREKYKAHSTSQKKTVHTTKKPPAEISVTSSTACLGVT
jgi:hypothetical protein